jgi:hypothetical protein
MSHVFVDQLGDHRVSLPTGSPWLPSNLVGAGVAVEDGELVAWCAPKEGRIEILSLTRRPNTDLGELAQWLALHGFTAEDAVAASRQMLQLIHSWPE